MFSVIFEVHPKPGRQDDYLAQAKHLKPMLEGIDGFIDNERFEDQQRPGWLLSHSTWRDEKSVVRWRTEGEHHAVQEKGRFDIFADYHLRVGDVCYDTAPPAEAPIQEQRFDETQAGTAKWASFTELVPQDGAAFAAQTDLLPAHLGLDVKDADIVEHSIFASIYTPGKLALLVMWRTHDGVAAWKPDASLPLKSLRHRIVRVVRDYGMSDRREAPQYYPAVPGAPATRLI